MKCLLCDEEFDENSPLGHFARRHSITGSQKSMLDYILALQKRATGSYQTKVRMRFRESEKDNWKVYNYTVSGDSLEEIKKKTKKLQVQIYETDFGGKSTYIPEIEYDIEEQKS